MAGHYFYDPRPFYGHNAYTGLTGLMPLDELFYGRYEPVPYWLDQRMAPASMYEENFYPGQKQMVPVGRRGPEVLQQQYMPQRGENNFMAYKRPEVRDDIYTDMYRRSPYNFNYNYGRDSGVSVAPIGGGAMMHPRGQTQDDTWVHTMSAPGHGHSFPASRGLPEPPPGLPTTRFSNGSGSSSGTELYRPMEMPANNNNMSTNNHAGGNYNTSNNRENMSSNHSRSMPIGNEQYRPMEMPANNNNMSNNKAGGNYGSSNNNSSNNRENIGNNHSSHGNKQMSTPGNNTGSFGAHGTSKSGNGQPGGKSSSTASKQAGGHNHNHSNSNDNVKQQQQQQQQKRYNTNDSSSSSESEDDDDDDEYEQGRNNGGAKWSMVASQHGHSGTAHGHKAGSHGFESNSRGLKNNSGSHSSSAKKSSSHMLHGSTNSKVHGSSQSKISKLLSFHDRSHDSSSSEDDEINYGHSKKGGHGSKGSSKGGLNHQQQHGSGHGHGHGSHVQSFQPNYGSQAKHMQFSSQSRSVELKVPICCDNCERKVRACLEKMDGVESVLCDQWNRKVIVYGNLKADSVLKRVRRVKKASELWQQAKQQQQLQLY